MVRRQCAKHGSRSRYLDQREPYGRHSSKIVKIKTSSPCSSNRNCRGTPLIRSTTSSQQRLSTQTNWHNSIVPVQAKEAYTLHLRHAIDQGHIKAYPRTEASDEVVLDINLLQKLCLSIRKNIYGIYSNPQHLEPQQCQVPFFHAFIAPGVYKCLSATQSPWFY